MVNGAILTFFILHLPTAVGVRLPSRLRAAAVGRRDHRVGTTESGPQSRDHRVALMSRPEHTAPPELFYDD
eukprot:COSAG06_NODE_20645_length_786_cov_11.133916_1_plen_70_part_10